MEKRRPKPNELVESVDQVVKAIVGQQMAPPSYDLTSLTEQVLSEISQEMCEIFQNQKKTNNLPSGTSTSMKRIRMIYQIIQT